MTTFLVSTAIGPDGVSYYKSEEITHRKQDKSCPLYPLEIDGVRHMLCYIPINLQPPLCSCNNLRCSNNKSPLSKKQKLIPPSIRLAKKMVISNAKPLMANKSPGAPRYARNWAQFYLRKKHGGQLRDDLTDSELREDREPLDEASKKMIYEVEAGVRSINKTALGGKVMGPGMPVFDD